jgi:hypothetical protein
MRFRWPRTGLVPATAGSAVALAIAAAVLVPGVQQALRSAPAILANLADFDWPRWIHNLADLLQIATPVGAVLAWMSTRRGRRLSTGTPSRRSTPHIEIADSTGFSSVDG